MLRSFPTQYGLAEIMMKFEKAGLLQNRQTPIKRHFRIFTENIEAEGSGCT